MQTRLDHQHAVRPVRYCRSRFAGVDLRLLLPSISLAVAVCAGSSAQAQGPRSGQPFVCTNASSCTTASATPTAVFLDASQFTPTTSPDMCGQINAALLAASTTSLPANIFTIDARAFTGTQLCDSNPFTNVGHTTNVGDVPVRLLLGNVTIVTSTPWFTPQVSHSIEGIAAGNPSNTSGTTIAACGPGLPIYSSGACTVGGNSVPRFPNGHHNPVMLTFYGQHGPFPPGTYACLVGGGGQGSQFPNGEGHGWESDASGEQISNIKFDLGGNDAIFGFYTQNEQERSVYSNLRFSDFGSLSGAAWFSDRSDAPTTQNGPTRNVLRDVSLTSPNISMPPDCVASGSSPGCYGIVQEGLPIAIQFNKGSCNRTPTAYASTVDTTTGAITAITVVDNGGGGCNSGTLPTVTSIVGATSTFGTEGAHLATATVTLNGGVVQSVTPTPGVVGNAGYPQPTLTGGIILENVNLFANNGMTGSNTGKIQEGVWADGITNPLIGHLHCQGMNGYCEHYAAGAPVTGGAFITHDSLTFAQGLIELGFGIDNNQTLISMSMPTFGGSGKNIIQDDRNNQTFAANVYPQIAEYLPGSSLTAAGQGPTLYGHLNNGSASSPNHDNAGTCSMSSTTSCTPITFAFPWNSPPACTASWAGGPVLNGQIRAVATTTTLTITSTMTETITVAYHCEGNPN